MRTITLCQDELVERLFPVGEDGRPLIQLSGSPSVKRAAEHVQWVRESYTRDHELWILVCHARAWNPDSLPRVWALTQ